MTEYFPFDPGIAENAAQQARTAMGLSAGDTAETALILGTGWGDALPLTNEQSVSLSELSGFGTLFNLEGHKRSLCIGEVEGCRVAMLRGRIHMNEIANDPRIPFLVRLQMELLIALGAKRFILTCAVGSLNTSLQPGSIVAIDDFLSLFVPCWPAGAGEFHSAADALDQDWAKRAVTQMQKHEVHAARGVHAYLVGPIFEGRRNDKVQLEKLGAHIVGMSVQPECAVASIHGIPVLALGFVTNTATEEHKHEVITARGKEKSELLGKILADLIVNSE